MHYECTLCLAALQEAFCDCGGVVHPVTDSRRVPGVRSAAELERVQRLLGEPGMEMLAALDATEHAVGFDDAAEFSRRVPDEVAMVRAIREVDHYDLRRLK